MNCAKCAFGGKSELELPALRFVTDPVCPPLFCRRARDRVTTNTQELCTHIVKQHRRRTARHTIRAISMLSTLTRQKAPPFQQCSGRYTLLHLLTPKKFLPSSTPLSQSAEVPN